MKKSKYLILKISIIICLGVLLLPHLTFCQVNSIKGNVRNELTEQSVEGVLILLKETNESVHSDDKGDFAFDKLNLNECTLEFSAPGYQKKRYQIRDIKDSVVNIIVNLSERLFQIQEILIISQRNAADDRSFDFYKSSDLFSTEDVMGRLGGISFIRRGNYAPEPVIRGLNTNQVNVTIDGMKMFGACTDKMDPVTSYVETENLQSIRLSKGAFQTLSGSTVGGEIDLKIFEPGFSNNNKLFGDINGGYQTNSSSLKTNLDLGFSSKKIALRFNFLYKKSNDYKAGGGEIVNYSGFEKYNALFSAVFKPGDYDLFVANILIDDAFNIGYPALTMDVESAKARIFGLTYTRKILFPWLLKLEAKAYTNSIDHIMDDTHRPDVPMHMDMPGLTRTSGGHLNSIFMITHSHLLQVQIDGYRSRSRAEMTMYPPNQQPMFMLTWPDVVRHVYGFAVNDEYKFNSSIQINTGFRFENVNSEITDKLGYDELKIFYPDLTASQSRNLISGFIRENFFINKNLSSELSFAYGERIPTVSEEFGFYLFNRFDGYDYIGNPGINMESSKQVQISLDYARSDYALKGTLFGYLFNDYIMGIEAPDLSPMTIGAKGVKIYENIPDATIIGLELLGSVSIHNNWELMSTLSYSYGEDSENEPLPLIPPLSGILSLRYTNSSFWIQMEGDWASAQNRVSISTGEMTSPSYLVTNLRSKINISSNFEVNIGIENLFDRNYYNHLDWIKIPRPGRSFYANLSVKLF